MSDQTSADTESQGVGTLELKHYLTILASWVVPGAGHLLLGRRDRAVVFFLLILVSLLIGCLLDGNLHRMLPDQPLTVLATLGSMGMGAPYFILRYLVGYQGEVVSAGYEYGTAFILTAGLMNLLLILDVWDILRGRKE
ncbi:MAG: DUF6677 family protein [Thermoanaerobaculia bacterium]